MKSKYLTLVSVLLISVATFAQKDQFKAAEKAQKEGNSQEVLTILQGAESLLATDADKAHFFYLKGNALFDLANKKIEVGKNLPLAAKAYQDLLAIEKASGKQKYSTQVTATIIAIKGKLVNSAIDDTKANKSIDAANKLYEAYLLDKKDTLNLYYAASTYVNAKDYTTALKLYEDLKTLNYSGKGKSYLAMNKLTGQEDFYNTATERDLVVKMGTHEKPRVEAIPSKRGEIFKNIALILVDQGKTEEAKKAISDARKANPEDSSLALSEANLYLETKDFDMYKKIIAEILEKNPNDKDLVFNLGVISANAKNLVDAEKYYKRVIEIDPNYVNAYINLSALKLDDETAIVDEMNKLGNNDKDMKRYNVLKTKRENLFKTAIPFLQKANEIDPANIDVAKTLLNVYSALEMPEYKALKAKVKEMEAAAKQ